MMIESPDVFWGLVASMYIGNVMLLVLNLPMVPLFAQILRLPVYILHPFIFGISIVGVYATTGRLFDLGLLAAFGFLGYMMGKLKFPAAPLILGFVLGDSMERALRQSMMMYQGDFSALFQRPISATMLALAAIVLIMPMITYFNRARVRAIAEGGEA
jgi:putative tricarboxylic transport membrane protein